jgi:hypothetical protein
MSDVEFYQSSKDVCTGNYLSILRVVPEEVQAVVLLKKLFPQWEPLYTDVDPCAICEAEISISKGDKREVRRRVEDEKVALRLFNTVFSVDGFVRHV